MMPARQSRDLSGPARLSELLTEALDMLSAIEPPPPSLRRLEKLMERLEDNRLHIAILGQFKRGKSSLLNALLGADVLPTAVLPLTSVPIFITAGRLLALTIHHKDGRPSEHVACQQTEDLRARLYALATEEANPQNRLGVERIEVRYPAAFAMAEGTVLIDTPGIGSTHRHNTEATLQFLPQCDVGLFVLSPDPPITETEITFLDAVKAQVPRLVFVLNKTDYLEPTERAKVVDFLQSVLQTYLGGSEPPQIYCLSARLALAARRANDPALMVASGLSTIEDQVIASLARQKSSLLSAALTRRTKAALVEAKQDIDLAIKALHLPLERLGDCIAAFERLLPQFEAERKLTQDLLVGDRTRALIVLEDEAEQLRRRAKVHLRDVMDGVLSADVPDPETATRSALTEAIPIFFNEELSLLASSLDSHLRAILSDHQERAEKLTASVRQAAAELFDLPWQPLDDKHVLEPSRQPYWVSQDLTGTLIPLGADWFEWLLPRATRLERLRRRLLDDANKMVARNVENLRWATLQNVEAAFRRLRSELDQGMSHAIEATHGAMIAAYGRRRAEAGRSDPEIERLSALSAKLAALGERVDALPSGESIAISDERRLT